MAYRLFKGGNVSAKAGGGKSEDSKDAEVRRSFLRKAAATALGGTVAALGLTSPALAQSKTKTGTHPMKPAGARTYHVYCCDQLYHYCTVSQENNCPNHWSWTCCAYVGSSLTRVTCYECYTHSCSNALFK